MAKKGGGSALELLSVGIDIGKDVFHVVGIDPGGRVVLRRRVRRLWLVREFERPPRCVVGMEACLSAHIVSRTIRKLGFSPRIIPARVHILSTAGANPGPQPCWRVIAWMLAKTLSRQTLLWAGVTPRYAARLL